MQLNDDFWKGWATAAMMAIVLSMVVSMSRCGRSDLIDYPKEQKTCVVVYPTPSDWEIQTCYPMPQTE